MSDITYGAGAVTTSLRIQSFVALHKDELNDSHRKPPPARLPELSRLASLAVRADGALPTVGLPLAARAHSVRCSASSERRSCSLRCAGCDSRRLTHSVHLTVVRVRRAGGPFQPTQTSHRPPQPIHSFPAHGSLRSSFACRGLPSVDLARLTHPLSEHALTSHSFISFTKTSRAFCLRVSVRSTTQASARHPRR